MLLIYSCASRTSLFFLLRSFFFLHRLLRLVPRISFSPFPLFHAGPQMRTSTTTHTLCPSMHSVQVGERDLVFRKTRKTQATLLWAYQGEYATWGQGLPLASLRNFRLSGIPPLISRVQRCTLSRTLSWLRTRHFLLFHLPGCPLRIFGL